MQTKILNFILVVSLSSFLGLYGCAAAVIGMGAAGTAGAFSYFTGKLTKTYESEYHDTVRASSDTLQKLKIPIAETISDELKTEINARRFDGTPVAIEIVRMDQDHTQVSVRTGSFGLWDKRVSEQIQGYIDQDLNRGALKAEKSSENLAQGDTQPAIGEGVKPEITVEELDEKSAQQTAPAKSIANLGRKTHAEKPSKSFQINPDSIFIIFFMENSNDLSEKATEKLDQIFEILIKNPGTSIMLNGYSDSTGTASYNEMISEIRANAVKSYLVGKGIQPPRIMAFGNGAQKFIASNKSAEGRQLNRRVEIELITP
jgi:outer membrane protein OmpA-like peptidoglycan-associated protein